MKVRLATLIDRGSHMSGKLGDVVIVLEPDGETRAGLKRWRLMLATPDGPAKITDQERNRRGASWRMQRRQAEGVESLGGTEL